MAVHVALLALAVTGVAALLSVVSVLAAIRTNAVRFGFVAVAFVVFAVRGALVVADGAGWFESPIAWDAWSVGLDAVVVAALYLGVVKR